MKKVHVVDARFRKGGNEGNHQNAGVCVSVFVIVRSLCAEGQPDVRNDAEMQECFVQR